MFDFAFFYMIIIICITLIYWLLLICTLPWNIFLTFLSRWARIFCFKLYSQFKFSHRFTFHLWPVAYLPLPKMCCSCKQSVKKLVWLKHGRLFTLCVCLCRWSRVDQKWQEGARNGGGGGIVGRCWAPTVGREEVMSEIGKKIGVYRPEVIEVLMGGWWGGEWGERGEGSFRWGNLPASCAVVLHGFFESLWVVLALALLFRIEGAKNVASVWFVVVARCECSNQVVRDVKQWNELILKTGNEGPEKEIKWIVFCGLI